MADMGKSARSSCIGCPLYIKSRQYCLKLKTQVPDPYNPLCRVPTQVQAVQPAASTQVVSQPVPVQESYDTRVADAIPEEVPPAPAVPSVPAVPQAVDELPYQDDPYTYNYQQALVARKALFAPTGVPGLDEILAGGFLRGKTYLVAGEAGCGKTILSIQFLLHGALNGEPGLYIAIDEPTNQLLRGLEIFGWNLRDLISSRKLMFVDMRTHFSKIYMRDERKHIEPRYIIEQILAAAKKINAKRLVIDPIAPLVYGGKEEDVLYAREFLREMVFAIEKTGELTTIMTSEIPTGSTKLSRFGVEEFLASGIIVLGIEEIYGNVERVMYIRKARWAPVKPSKYIFDIVSGKGIVIREPLSEYLKRMRRG